MRQRNFVRNPLVAAAGLAGDEVMFGASWGWNLALGRRQLRGN